VLAELVIVLHFLILKDVNSSYVCKVEFLVCIMNYCSCFIVFIMPKFCLHVHVCVCVCVYPRMRNWGDNLSVMVVSLLWFLPR
jgi:hypothetical protein